MFGTSNTAKETDNGKSAKAKGTSAPSAVGGHSLNSIVQGTAVDGTVRAQSDIRVDGTIKGKLFCDAKVIIGPTGHVEGEIRCQNAVIEGKFEGILEVKELLNVRETATINGDVSTSKLIVQPGGVFNVTCKMGGTTETYGSNHRAADKEMSSAKTAKVAG